MMNKINYILVIIFSWAFSLPSMAALNHPSLILTQDGVRNIKEHLGQVPVLDHTLNQTIVEVDLAMDEGIDVPIPKDLAGGYSHEHHKRNFLILQKAGLLFQITGDEKYANYVHDVLIAYAELFPTLDRHPATRSYARGKFFWQCLNDANWLVYVSQAYDCIYDWLEESERAKLNGGLFRPLADFLSIETPQFFNRIHNHSTWGNAAVGMIGLVMEDEELIKRALYGVTADVPGDLVKDNDGGLIELPGQTEAGFFAQIDHSFSPDGYYTEGPYYQRYAMYPFLIFAQALANKRPDIKIFEYKDSVLIKGVYALLNQTNSAGEFFPLNDAQKGMSHLSRELITAVNIAYHFGDRDPSLLSIVEKQGRIPLNDAGLSSAISISKGLAKPFEKRSIELRDGANGEEGANGILRNTTGPGDLCLVMKYSKHGMGHGHFDKLSFSYYHNDKEVFQDYGAARWVNIEQKDGGGYLKENQTWAKQTIAHNTLVVNHRSQFDAEVKEADLHHSDPYLFDASDVNVQVMSAKDNNAYPDVRMHRTMVLIQDESFENPVILDLFRANSSEKNTYDLPFYFMGDVMYANFEFEPGSSLNSLGKEYGYQHLWKEASGKPAGNNTKLNWFNDGHFYSLTTWSDPGDELIFGRVGANDPNFNLRRDPVFILRRQETGNTLFASLIEVHGNYNPIDEIATNAYSNVKLLEVLWNDESYTVARFINKNGDEWTYAMSNDNASGTDFHEIEIQNTRLKWQGPFHLKKQLNDIKN